MAKVSPAQTSFNGGEFSPIMNGRVDFDGYKNALGKCLNNIPLVQGPVVRRPGTMFVAEVKTSAKKTRIISFEFSTTQAYIIEAGDLYLRFFKDHGRIESPPGTPVEVVSPYTEAQLATLKWVQSNDILYLVHPSHAPRKLSRTSHTVWTLTTIDFKDGPYLPTNTDTAKTITPSATTGAGITLTATGHTPFVSTDVGRLVRLKHSTTWGYAKIVGFTSSTVVTADVKSNFGAITATSDWRLGLWSDTTGWPTCTVFFEDRLCFAGSPGAPQRIDMSMTGDYENMAPSSTAGTVTDDSAVAITLNSKDVQTIRWMSDDEKGLLVGTVRGEWTVKPASTADAVTPTNVAARQSTSYGSADIQVVQTGKAVLYTQRARRQLRELAYVYEVDGFRSPNMTVLAEHITTGGIVELAYQGTPQSIIWVVRTDGTLLGLTYERDQKVVGWHAHTLGGFSDAGKTVAAKVEAVAVIPSPDGTRDELYVVVQRYVNGATKRYIEYMTKIWESGDARNGAFFVDCGLTYNGAPTTTITGLSHLNGETVALLADGSTHSDKVVSGGQITLDRSSSLVHVGYRYYSDAETLRLDAGAADGTALGKTQRTHRVMMLLHESLGLKVGPSFDSMSRITFRTAGHDLGVAVPLFSGIIEVSWEGDYTKDNVICWRWDEPLPGTVLAVLPHMYTQDR